MNKYKVNIKEVIVHEFEVEEVNEYMAKEAGRNRLANKLKGRILGSHDDISVEEIK